MRYLNILLFVLLSSTPSWSCDVCGCQLGGYSFGILSQAPSHFIGMRYSQARFNAAIENNILEDEYSDDTYSTVELMGRYVISKRWQISVILPYSYNQMKGNTQNVEVAGLSDPVLMGYFNALNSSDQMKDWSHSLLLGAGVKLPLGEFDAEDNEEIINRNFQLGSGSLDYLISGIYTFKYKSVGLNLEGSYKMNTENSIGYHFGNQLTASSKLYYAIIQPTFSVLPYVGLTYEESKMHTENGFKQLNTGGSATLADFGVQVLYKKMMLMANYSLIASQDYNTDSRSVIESNNRFQVGLVFNIDAERK